MMTIRSHQYHLFFIVTIVICALGQADIGAVNIGLQYQLQQCINGSSSLLHGLLQHQSCFKSSLLRCLLHHDPAKEQYVSTEPLCGVINSGLQPITHVWHIAVPSQYSLLIDFLHFHLPASPQCKSVASVLLKHATDRRTYTYCGYRVPWNISFPQSYVIVQCIDDYNTPKGFHFVITFQAFDIGSTSVTLT